MRRLVLIVMMCLLSFQWSWAAAASVCAHEREQDKVHFGHHAHQHGAADDTRHASSNAGDEATDASVNYHPDCQACHGIGAACLASVVADVQAWVDHGALPAYGRFLPDPPIQSLLRPPLHLVA
ncbi:hypothetical protein [Variovorax sp. KK3]|uniref:hypothetical protein n=1 Tax=Variovorax sp. KK3 TaxID=1855728 RepID=UPI00097C0DE9|nr:hypothetical protein [Variovorax sp. KK3]